MYKIIILSVFAFGFAASVSQTHAAFFQKKGENYAEANKKAGKAFEELDNETDNREGETTENPYVIPSDNTSGKLEAEDKVAIPADNTTGVPAWDGSAFDTIRADNETEDNKSSGYFNSDNGTIDNKIFSERASDNGTADNFTVEKSNPRGVGEKKHPIACRSDYSMVNGLPDWVVNPKAEGYPLTAVGLGIYGEGGLSGQMRAARIQAQGELAKMIKVKVDNELNVEKMVEVSSAEDKADTKISSESRQRASEILEGVEELRCWIDPSNNDYYVLVGIAGDKL